MILLKKKYVPGENSTKTSKILSSERITPIAKASHLQTWRLLRGVEKRYLSHKGDRKLEFKS